VGGKPVKASTSCPISFIPLLNHEITFESTSYSNVCSSVLMRQYIPAIRELVLGVIIARHADGYRVDLGSAQMAQLDALAFEGATKRSKPNLKVGAYRFTTGFEEACNGS
jgi:hypothetical protein